MAESCFLPKARTVTNYTLVTSDSRSGTDSTTSFGVDWLESAELLLKCTAVSGTNPTLDVYVQRLNPDETLYDDLAHFTQLTATSDGIKLDFINGGNLIHASSSASIAAGTVRTVNFGGFWRIYWTTSGTFTFAVYGNFKGSLT